MREPTGPLEGTGISRQQLRIASRPGALVIENIGRCPALVNGEPFDKTVVVEPIPESAPVLPIERLCGIRLWCGLVPEEIAESGAAGDHLLVVCEVRDPHRAGELRAGDAIVAIDGERLQSLGACCRAFTRLSNGPQNGRVSLTVRSAQGVREVLVPHRAESDD